MGREVRLRQGWADIDDLVDPIVAAGTRTLLTTGTTYYVRTDGSDSNDGSANDAAHAFLTILGAFAYIMQYVDAAGQVVTISVADGTYTGQIFLAGSLVGQTSAGSVIITGGSGAILTSNTFATLNILHAGSRARIQGGISIRNSGSGSCVRVADNAYAEFGNVTWGACGLSHIEVAMGAAVYMFENYTINGNAAQHIRVQGGSVLEMYDLAHTVSGSRSFSTAFAVVGDNGIIQTANTTYTGTVTGKRFDTYAGGGIQTFVDDLTYFPGDSAGTVSPGGWYA